MSRPRPTSSRWAWFPTKRSPRSEEHTSELQSQSNLVCRLLLEKKNTALAFFLYPPLINKESYHIEYQADRRYQFMCELNKPTGDVHQIFSVTIELPVGTIVIIK